MKMQAILIMIPVGAITQMLYLWYTKNGSWENITWRRKLGAIFMGSVAAIMTGLLLWDVETILNLKVTPARFLFAMLTASIVGGRLVSFVATQGLSTVLGKLGIEFPKKEDE